MTNDELQKRARQYAGIPAERGFDERRDAHLAGQRDMAKCMIEWCEKNAWKDTEQEPPQLWLHDIKREFGE